MTWRQLLEEGTRRLNEAGVADAKLDAWYLMEEICGLDLPHFLLVENEETGQSVPGAGHEMMIKAYQAALTRRSMGEPLQYITGKAAFMGYTFTVGPDVLIPRQDTETLCEEALRRLKERTDKKKGRIPPGQSGCSDAHNNVVRVLDLCTGSGCILISLLLLGEETCGAGISGVGADISEAALAQAGENAQRLCPDKTRSGELAFVCSDMFEKISGTFDMILSNPPYIRSGEIPGLMREVAGHEPLTALDGGEDGLAFYRILAREADKYLVPGGDLLMEIGFDQGDDVRKLLKENGWKDIQIIRDLAGNDRVEGARKA